LVSVSELVWALAMVLELESGLVSVSVSVLVWALAMVLELESGLVWALVWVSV
jgi:hypothetical protein